VEKFYRATIFLIKQILRKKEILQIRKLKAQINCHKSYFNPYSNNLKTFEIKENLNIDFEH
jgi:hypothetical protein